MAGQRNREERGAAARPCMRNPHFGHNSCAADLCPTVSQRIVIIGIAAGRSVQANCCIYEYRLIAAGSGDRRQIGDRHGCSGNQRIRTVRPCDNGRVEASRRIDMIRRIAG